MIEESTARVVVGAGLGGSRTCTGLCKLGYTGPIVLIGDEAGLPYDRPPLSKAVFRGKRDPQPLKVGYRELEIDVWLGVTAEALDVERRRVLTSAGPVHFSHLVIATGASPVRLPGGGEQLVLRTVIDEDLDRAWTASWTDASGRLTAALAIDRPKFTSAVRSDITNACAKSSG